MTKQYFIAVSQDCKAKLNSLKTHPRESYGDVVDRLISEYEEKSNLSYDGAVEKAEKIHEGAHPEEKPKSTAVHTSVNLIPPTFSNQDETH